MKQFSVTTYGVLGVGSIAEAIVTGVCSTDAAPDVVLSPRSAQRSARLAERFPSVRVADHNQAVVDAADVVVLCLLPELADEVLSGLSFRSGQAVVSAMAGVSMVRLADLVAPAAEIARSVPVPAVASRASVTPVHPGTTSATGLYDRLGGSMVIADERAYESLSVASATVAAYFDYLRTIADWLVGHGIEESSARRYVADHFAALEPELRTPDVDFSVLASAHTTPGGLNEQFARDLDQGGVHDVVRRGLDDLLQRISPDRA